MGSATNTEHNTTYKTRSAFFLQGVEAIRRGATTETMWSLLRKDRQRRKRLENTRKSLAERGLPAEPVQEGADEWQTWPAGAWVCQCGQWNMPREVDCNCIRRQKRCEGTVITYALRQVRSSVCRLRGLQQAQAQERAKKSGSADEQMRQRQGRAKRAAQTLAENAIKYHWVCPRREKNGLDTKVFLKSEICHQCSYAPQDWTRIGKKGNPEDLENDEEVDEEVSRKARTRGGRNKTQEGQDRFNTEKQRIMRGASKRGSGQVTKGAARSQQAEVFHGRPTSGAALNTGAGNSASRHTPTRVARSQQAEVVSNARPAARY